MCVEPKEECNKCNGCEIIRENIGKASECMEARKDVNNICFDGGDATHLAELAKTERAMANCQNIARKLNCK